MNNQNQGGLEDGIGGNDRGHKPGHNDPENKKPGQKDPDKKEGTKRDQNPKEQARKR